MSAEEQMTGHLEIEPVSWLNFDHDRTRSYPLSNMHGYPLQRGWTSDEIEVLRYESFDRMNRSPEEALAMIQSWMTLGLLEAVLDEKIPSSLYVKTNENSQSFFQSSALRTQIDGWYQQLVMSPMSAEDLALRQDAITTSLKEAQSWNHNLSLVEEDGTGHLHVAQVPTFNSVMRLTTIVAEAVWSISQLLPVTDDRFALDYSWWMTEENEAKLAEKLSSKGWCPTLFQGLSELNRARTSFFEYMSMVEPRGQTQAMHEGCKDRKCTGFNVKGGYKPHHTTSCRGCATLKPSIAEIGICLRKGGIPIIDGVALLEDTEDSVKSCTLGDMGNYVAFSHVWSDGLGSTTEKRLPKCQIEKLLDNTLQSCKATCFWIDSLCVPQQQDLRKRAITLMAKTYQSAAAVIVLDARVQHYSIRDPLEEQLVALGLSVWQQRLWTLQEGSLAKRPLFKFSDALVDRETILEKGYAKRYTPVVRFAQILLDSVTKWVLGGTVSVGAL